MKRPGEYPTPTLVFGVFVLLAVVGLVVAASTSGASFGAYNGAWDGTSKLRSIATDAGAEPQVANDMAAYSRVTPNDTVAVILSPERNYSSADRQRLRRFLERGGTLVVAGDYGAQTNRLLAALKTDARLDGRPLRDDRHRYRSPAFPVAGNVSNGSLVANVSAVTLNHGTAVTPGNATVLVNTSDYAYLDANRNRKLDDNEMISSMAVATVERVGDGRVFVVGDSSIMINSMLDRPGNRAFVRALIGGHGTVLLDYSHTSRIPPLALAVLLLRETPLLQLLVGGSGLALVLLWAQHPETVKGLWSSVTSKSLDRTDGRAPSMSESAMVTYVRDRHPDWDSDRVQRVVAAVRDERSD